MSSKYNFKRFGEVNFTIKNGTLEKTIPAIGYTTDTIHIHLNRHLIDLSELKCNIGPFSLYSSIKEIWNTADFGVDCGRMNPIAFTFPICMVGVVPSGHIKYELCEPWTLNDPYGKLISPIYSLPEGIDFRDL